MCSRENPVREEIKILGLNHLTFAVEDLEKSVELYKVIFGDRIVAISEKLAYFDVGGLWIALNVENAISSEDRDRTYTHVAFSMTKEDQVKLKEKLDSLNIPTKSGRTRNSREGQSLYLRDYDGHLLEFHDKGLSDRLSYYKDERPDVALKTK